MDTEYSGIYGIKGHFGTASDALLNMWWLITTTSLKTIQVDQMRAGFSVMEKN